MSSDARPRMQRRRRAPRINAALTRDTAAHMIAGRADAPPHVLAVAEHLFTVVVLTVGSTPSLFDWHRSCGGGGRWGPMFSTLSERINEDESQKRVKLVD